MEIHEGKSRGGSHGRKKLLIWTSLLLLLALAGAASLALLRRSGSRSEAESRQKDAQGGRKVETAEVRMSPTERTLLLIGEARPYFSVTLYARVSGYLDRLYADIGDVVRKGQVLAHVESPEQEQAYNSARADAFNKKRIATRTKVLRRRKLVSQQQEDQAASDANISEANLRTQAVLRGYQDITASFDGVISNRFVDPGWLLQNASGSQAASQPLFTLTQTSPLRVFVYVDQKDAPYVRVQDEVEITVPNQAGARLPAQVEMIAGELDPKTRTLLTELIVDNADRRIVPGSFVQVRMKVHTPSFLELPVQALVLREKEPCVALVAGGAVHYAKIELAENDGENILIRSGVKSGDQVVLNIGNSVQQGQKVQVAAPQAAGIQGAPPRSRP